MVFCFLSSAPHLRLFRVYVVAELGVGNVRPPRKAPPGTHGTPQRTLRVGKMGGITTRVRNFRGSRACLLFSFRHHPIYGGFVYSVPASGVGLMSNSRGASPGPRGLLWNGKMAELLLETGNFGNPCLFLRLPIVAAPIYGGLAYLAPPAFGFGCLCPPPAESRPVPPTNSAERFGTVKWRNCDLELGIYGFLGWSLGFLSSSPRLRRFRVLTESTLGVGR